MMKMTSAFLADEDGAVTNDWVVLTAAIVTLGVAVVASVRSGTNTMGDGVQSELSKSIPTIDWNMAG